MWDEFIKMVGSITLAAIAVGGVGSVIFCSVTIFRMRNMDVVPMCNAYRFCKSEISEREEEYQFGYCNGCFNILNQMRIESKRKKK